MVFTSCLQNWPINSASHTWQYPCRMVVALWEGRFLPCAPEGNGHQEEMRLANTNSSKDPRSHFCALTVQQNCQGCIWLQCQLRDKMFLVCISESKLCSQLPSALHWDRSTRTTGICPRPRQYLAIFPVIACFPFPVFHPLPSWVPPFFKSIFMFLLSHTQGTAFFKPPAFSCTACRPAQDQTVHGKERILFRIADLCVSQWKAECSGCLLLGQELVKHTRRSWIHLVCGEAVLSKSMTQEWVTCFCSYKACAGRSARTAQQIQWPSTCQGQACSNVSYNPLALPRVDFKMCLVRYQMGLQDGHHSPFSWRLFTNTRKADMTMLSIDFPQD